MKTKNRMSLTPIEVCTLMAHETASMLDAAGPEALETADELRAALAVYSAQQDLGGDGEALLAWVDAEIDGAKRFAADGTDCPRVIDPDRLLRVPDAAAQMDAVRMLLQTAMGVRLGTPGPEEAPGRRPHDNGDGWAGRIDPDGQAARQRAGCRYAPA